MSDDKLAELIRDDGIDILIDLSGHSNGERLAVFARKPAPIQVTAWGHATGTGMPAMDYLFADPVVVPPECHRFFAERIYDLPCVIAAEALETRSTNLEPPMLERGHVTFGVFNRPEKFTDGAIRLWSRVIDRVPGSRLLIKGGGLEQEDRRRAYAEKFASSGIGEDRLTILGATPRDEHLAAIQGVDICLDPFPQNGGVSTWEALRMGVPVVCMLGSWITNRLSASIVSSIGLRDWVAETENGYLEIARKSAAAPDQLRALRCSLPDRIAVSPAGDLAAYTRAVEAAYRAMWTEFCDRSPGS
jgi:predicted O-linked N-acetylglucosamine transferase (SPINDLY family)